MKLAYPHVAARVYNTPLLVHPTKALAIAAALEPRLLGKAVPDWPQAASDDSRRRGFAVTESGVAMIPVMGTLVSRGDWVGAWSGLTSYEGLRAQLQDAAEDPRVKGILLELDSPGGEVAGLFDLVDYLGEVRQTKPVWAAAADDAYSAAYDIAAAAERVYVTQTGGVGSVGVIALHLDHSQADQAEGLRYTVFRAGKYKAELNSYEPLTDHASASLQAELDRLYQLFAAKVAGNRGLSVEQVLTTEAQTYHGPGAIEIGFADRVGTVEQALADLQAELEERERARWPGMQARHTAEGGNMASAIPVGVTIKVGGAKASDTDTPRGSAAHDPQTDKEAIMPPESIKRTPVETAQPTSAAPVAAVEQTNASAAPAPPDVEQIRASARLDERSYQTTVRQLCTLAGRPELADPFIREAVPVDAVREQLLEQRAAADQAEQISTQVAGATASAAPGPTIDLQAVYQHQNARYRERLAGGRQR